MEPRNLLIWHSPCESIIHCSPKNVCLSNFRKDDDVWTKAPSHKKFGFFRHPCPTLIIYYTYKCLTAVNKVWVTHFIGGDDLVTQYVNFFWSKSGEEIALLLLLHGSHPTFSWTFSPIGSVWEKLWRFELSKPSWNSWQHFTFLLSWLF